MGNGRVHFCVFILTNIHIQKKMICGKGGYFFFLSLEHTIHFVMGWSMQKEDSIHRHFL